MEPNLLEETVNNYLGALVSTEGKEEDVARGLKAGAVAYLKKPFQREDLLKIIGRLTTSQASL